MESIHLIGAETVASAARTMNGAASEMNTAAYNIECAMERQRTFMADWLQRFEAALERHAAMVAAPPVVIEPAPALAEAASEQEPTPLRRMTTRGPERRKQHSPLAGPERRAQTRRIDDDIPF